MVHDLFFIRDLLIGVMIFGSALILILQVCSVVDRGCILLGTLNGSVDSIGSLVWLHFLIRELVPTGYLFWSIAVIWFM